MPLCILVLMEGCTELEALKGANAFALSSAGSICDPAHAPSEKVQITQKAQLLQSPYDSNKIQLPSAQVQKASASLRGMRLVFALDLTCETESLWLNKVLNRENVPDGLTHYSQAYEINEDISIEQLRSDISNDPCVRGVSPQGEITFASLPIPRTNDPLKNNMVHLISSNYAHAYEHLAQQQANNTTVIAFIDSGANCSHPDLQDNLISGCGFNILADGTLPTDTNGHGSHTLGLVVAGTNNSEGIVGIGGPRVLGLAIKVTDGRSGFVSDAVNGINTAIASGADVINISMSSNQFNADIEDAVIRAVNEGAFVSIAAGNGDGSGFGVELGVDLDVSPAGAGISTAGAMTVASMDTLTDRLSRFSNFGSRVEIATYGSENSNISGTVGGLLSLGITGGYHELSGTSQAAPIIGGAAALLVQFFKDHNVSYSPAIIEQLIANSSDQNPQISVSGNRVFNFSKLVRSAYEYANIPLCNN